MTGFTLSVEQLQSAPPEVRQWVVNAVAQEIAKLSRPHPASPPEQSAELAACSFEEAVQVFELIRDDFAAVHVFLELARDAHPGYHDAPLRILALSDILRATRLDERRLAGCFDAISQAFQRVRNDPEAALFGFDQAHHVFIHETTQRSIQRLWLALTQPQVPSQAPAATLPTAPSGGGFTLPHLGPSEDIAAHQRT
jgi:hypothetical protein